MPRPISRRQFFFRHSQGQGADLLQAIAAALGEIAAAGHDVSIVRVQSDPVANSDGDYQVLLIEGPEGWEVVCEHILVRHSLSCRRYI